MSEDKIVDALKSKIARQRNEIARLEQIISRVIDEKLMLVLRLREYERGRTTIDE